MDNTSENKILQCELLKILIEFDRVCKELKIKYSLSSGTLLGAVRHRGFIPWDDDIDVIMTRHNYEMFSEKAQSILSNKYFLQTYETDKKYPHHFAKFLNTEIVAVEKANMELNIQRGLFIDIFPVDIIPNNKVLRLLYVITIRFLKVVKYAENYSAIVKNSASNSKKCIKILFYPIAALFGSNKVNKIETFVRCYFNNSDNSSNNRETYGDYDPGILQVCAGREMLFSLFEEYMELEFEKNKFLCIKNFDDYLKKNYGDYMQLPPVEKRISHHDLIIYTKIKE